ncbi:MAG: helix-turn-helix domain-containing protein [Mycobacterium sp.]|nr:helix-turn-helix domain-containing protein [Mycobacterium sp.]
MTFSLHTLPSHSQPPGGEPPTIAQSPLPVEAIPDPELREEWEHFRGFGWSDQRIAARLNVKWDTVQNWVRRFHNLGRPVRPPAGRRRQRVAELFAQGFAPQQIAEKLGVPRHTVHDDLCRLRLTRGHVRPCDTTTREAG